jgi:hypothetical protein
MNTVEVPAIRDVFITIITASMLTMFPCQAPAYEWNWRVAKVDGFIKCRSISDEVADRFLEDNHNFALDKIDGDTLELHDIDTGLTALLACPQAGDETWVLILVFGDEGSEAVDDVARALNKIRKRLD